MKASRSWQTQVPFMTRRLQEEDSGYSFSPRRPSSSPTSNMNAEVNKYNFLYRWKKIITIFRYPVIFLFSSYWEFSFFLQIIECDWNTHSVSCHGLFFIKAKPDRCNRENETFCNRGSFTFRWTSMKGNKYLVSIALESSVNCCTNNICNATMSPAILNINPRLWVF